MRPDRTVRALVGGHLFACAPGSSIVDHGFEPVTEARSSTRTDGTIRINHYLTKSVEELVKRRTARAIDTGDEPKLGLAQWIEFDRDWNQVEDRTALRWLPRMRELAAEFPDPRVGPGI